MNLGIHLSALAVALLHAALPTHWLPFVLVGHARSWDRARTLRVVVLAGSAHVLATTALGLLAALGGAETARRLEASARPVAAAALVLLALFFLARDFRRQGEEHSHRIHQAGRASAVLGLVAFLTFSPCEAVLPLFFVAGPHGWSAVATLALVVGLGSVAGMFALVWIAYDGATRVNLHRFERYEGRAVAALLLGLAVAIWALG